MIAARCIFAGYLIAVLAAISLIGLEGSLMTVLIGWLGGGCLAALLALAWHLLVPEHEPRVEPSAERWQWTGPHLLDWQKEAA